MSDPSSTATLLFLREEELRQTRERASVDLNAVRAESERVLEQVHGQAKAELNAEHERANRFLF